MVNGILTALGGLGLFLIGMHMLSQGLRHLAGRQLRAVLADFTSTPLSGAVTGAAATALVQSSSATTVTAVGFVSAGLLTFPQALGIIFGANVGTTLTGWLVAILGFKLDLGQTVLPLVLVGALMQLFAKGPARSLGQALAGFSLLFMGIDAMKGGLSGFEGIVTPENFPDDTILGRLQLVGIGVAITLVTQSSSAGVATALAALGAGAISFPQAAALVIGMDVGTTFTAALATIGGSTMARRTGLAHVIYNVMTGILAFLLLPLAATAFEALALDDAQIGLVVFHTGFNFLGLVLVLPFAAQFARLVEVMVPASGPRLTHSLDSSLLDEMPVAIQNAAATTEEMARVLCLHVAVLLGSRPAGTGRMAWVEEEFRQALQETRDFVRQIHSGGLSAEQIDMFESILHTLDHLSRLLHRCDQTARLKTLERVPDLHAHASDLATLARAMSETRDARYATEDLNAFREDMQDKRQSLRARLIEDAASGRISHDEAAERMDALRWLNRSVHHLWRIAVHLDELHGRRARADLS